MVIKMNNSLGFLIIFICCFLFVMLSGSTYPFFAFFPLTFIFIIGYFLIHDKKVIKK